jgi:Lipocalin-like domain
MSFLPRCACEHALHLADRLRLSDNVVATDYSQTVIGREKRNYAWITVRTATLSDSDDQLLSALRPGQRRDAADSAARWHEAGALTHD